MKEYSINKIISIVEGGPTGQLSIYNALIEINRLYNQKDTIVLIHDAVRPLIDKTTISDNIKITKEKGSCITTNTAEETILLTSDGTNLESVPKRSFVKLAKAPQTFYLKDIINFHQKAQKDNLYDFIDSCSIMMHYNKIPFLYDGPTNNIKITTQQDYYIVKAILNMQEDMQIYKLGE